MKERKRYSHNEFRNCFIKIFRIMLLFALIIHCILFICITRYKSDSILGNDSRDIFKLSEELRQYSDNYGIDNILNEYYPTFWDYGRTGLQKAALIIDPDTKEIIASNDFTLPENKLLRKLKSEYTEILEKISWSQWITFPHLEKYKRTDLNLNGQKVILLTAMRVNYYTYFLKYFLTADIILFLSAFSVSVYISARKNTENMKNEYRRSLINSLSHDLKTPLAAISVCAENLIENADTDKRIFYEKSILENVCYANNIVNRALELVKTEQMPQNPKFVPVDIYDIIETIWYKYSFQSSEKHLEFIINCSLSVKCDRGLIQQMFDNLISNAVKYSDDNAIISVETQGRNIIISNDFTGTIDTDVKKLTDPFVRGCSSRTGSNSSGLGLAIAKNIADIHKFRLTVDIHEGKFKVNISA